QLALERRGGAARDDPLIRRAARSAGPSARGTSWRRPRVQGAEAVKLHPAGGTTRAISNGRR
ncbi:MAG: hypothetical protein ACRD15_18760, partial [Vicinamibacterales bacterium]